jgi:tripartite-type tricarboxylate transporter receptor subunit TctC
MMAMTLRHGWKPVFFAAVLALHGGMASAAWPDKALRVILPYAAGGSGDIIFRSIQAGLEKGLGQSAVVDFRTGANGLIGVREAVTETVLVAEGVMDGVGEGEADGGVTHVLLAAS